jgi:hypothetical protein
MTITTYLAFSDEKDDTMNTAFIKKLHNGENLPPKQTSVGSVPAKVDVNSIVLHRYRHLKGHYLSNRNFLLPVKTIRYD